MLKATSELITQSSRHMVISSHGQLVTGQLVTANCLLQHSAILAVLMFRFMF